MKKFIYIPSVRICQLGAWKHVHGRRAYFRILRVPSSIDITKRAVDLRTKGVTEVFSTHHIDTGTARGKYGVNTLWEEICSKVEELNKNEPEV